MNCPKCKNPIDYTALECEWCGNILQKTKNTQTMSPLNEIEKSFSMRIEEVSRIMGRGTIAAGCIENGIIKVGEEVQIIDSGTETKSAIVTGVIISNKILDKGQAGEDVGLLLRGVNKDEIKRGMIICRL